MLGLPDNTPRIDMEQVSSSFMKESEQVAK